MRWLLHSCHRRGHSHRTPLSSGSHSPSASSLQCSGPCKALDGMAQMFCLGLSIQQSIKVTSMCPLCDLADLYCEYQQTRVTPLKVHLSHRLYFP